MVLWRGTHLLVRTLHLCQRISIATTVTMDGVEPEQEEAQPHSSDSGSGLGPPAKKAKRVFDFNKYATCSLLWYVSTVQLY